MPDGTASGLTELKIPAQTEFIGLAKRVATSLGGMFGFSLDEIDELSIAVTQACGSVIEAADEAWGRGATLKLSFTPTEKGLTVDVEAVAPRAREALPAAQRPPVHVHNAELELRRALAREMIKAFVDDFLPQVDTSRRQIRYRMVKYLVS